MILFTLCLTIKRTVMRKFLFLLLCVCCANGIMKAQGDLSKIVTQTNGRIAISEIIQTSDVNAKDLYTKALLWVSQTFKSPKSVIQVQNPEIGLLTIKAQTSVTSLGSIEYSMTLQFKDGRCKYTITDIYFLYSEICHSAGVEDTRIEDAKNYLSAGSWKKKIYGEFIPLITSLKHSILKVSEEW